MRNYAINPMLEPKGRMKNKNISEEAKNTTIDRTEFDAIMKKLIGTKPITKQGIAAKVRREGRDVSFAGRRSVQRSTSHKAAPPLSPSE